MSILHPASEGPVRSILGGIRRPRRSRQTVAIDSVRWHSSTCAHFAAARTVTLPEILEHFVVIKKVRRVPLGLPPAVLSPTSRTPWPDRNTRSSAAVASN